ncbi:posphoenolpyruvate synthetase regulatory kinase/phosphorylase PpsR [Pelagibaculum spongiae]|uniref:Putative phosphoenolpyruvate synthase regulatory protein n=1 Tax=Pelagibaculum spongiae TaxID=2080658 RepID=A0A2V1GTM2_9GAMM|nr:pyruvate, water dikinase regulatory protein [Pelagibaculum spongiae]PVZ68958.1 phosphoenolpyruvate synthase regulatory protein [Pelagibaculum spongiae]
MGRTAFIISDRTGITAEMLGHSLMTQFPLQFEQVTLPFVDTPDKARDAVRLVNEATLRDGAQAIVFATIVDRTIGEIIATANAVSIDFFRSFIGQLEDTLGLEASAEVGAVHPATDSHQYETRIEAINYSLANDDGARVRDYDKADIILVGVSRSGKTPTCLYLAMQFGLKAANYPFTEDNFSDTDQLTLPKELRPHRNKLFGLTIEAERLHAIRNERRANSRYSSRNTCYQEVRDLEALFVRERIPHISTTQRSIEELATKIIQESGVQRHLA